jgi:hypothetical protein
LFRSAEAAIVSAMIRRALARSAADIVFSSGLL